MAETVRHDYECSSNELRTWIVPYARLTDATPIDSHPAELTSLTEGVQLTGTIISLDTADSVAVIDFAASNVYYHEVRNVLTYDQGAEATWGVINIGDAVYYDSSSTMPAGVYLSTSPLDEDADANTLFGFVVPCTDDDRSNYPTSPATAATEECGVIQVGAGAAGV